MTTNSLAKKYPSLSTDERFSLLRAASARGDEVEVKRLPQSAPLSTFGGSHLFGRALAFVVVSMIHRMEFLNLAAFFFKASSIEECGAGETTNRCHDGPCLFGYLMNIHAEAWQEFRRGTNWPPQSAPTGYRGKEPPASPRGTTEAGRWMFTTCGPRSEHF